MGLEVHVAGSRDLLTVRRKLREVGDKGLGKKLSKGLLDAAKQLQPEIRAEAERAMPRRYGQVLSKSLRFRLDAREQRSSARVTFKVYGDGRKEKRDVPRLNRGELRHPVFGRTRRLKNHAKHKATSMANPWVAQKVKPGFVDRPVEQLAPAVQREMHKVIRDVADEITRG